MKKKMSLHWHWDEHCGAYIQMSIDTSMCAPLLRAQSQIQKWILDYKKNHKMKNIYVCFVPYSTHIGVLCMGVPKKEQWEYKKMQFLGSGLSSICFELGSDYVLKATRDTCVRKWQQHVQQQQQKNHHLYPRIDGVYINQAAIVGHVDMKQCWARKSKRPMPLSLIVQERLNPLPNTLWRHIKKCAYKSGYKKLLWCHKAGLPLFGVMGSGCASRLSKFLTLYVMNARKKGYRYAHKMGHLPESLKVLSEFLYHHEDAGIDIDHVDNWGIDKQGYVHVLDPVFGSELLRKL